MSWLRYGTVLAEGHGKQEGARVGADGRRSEAVHGQSGAAGRRSAREEKRSVAARLAVGKESKAVALAFIWAAARVCRGGAAASGSPCTR